MKSKTSHTGKFHIVERLSSSRNGNPRYLCIIDGWACRTGVDSDLGYSVANFDGKEVTATIGTHYGKATIDSLTFVNSTLHRGYKHWRLDRIKEAIDQ